MPMKYMTVLEASKKWGITDRRVRFLCSQGRIRGIIQQGRRYLIPENAEKPCDERVRHNKRAKALHYNDFTRIDFLKGMIAEAPEPSDSVIAQMQEDFARRFSWSCMALEHETFSQEEADCVLDGMVVPGYPLSEHLALVGVKDAVDYALESIQERKPLSQNIIRSIHSLALIEDPMEKGKYRRVRVRIRGAQSSPVYLDLMEPRINDLLNVNTQRKKTMHPIERIARFHLEFEEIHPFQEGNGRVGRILMNFELMQSGYSPISIEPDEEDAYQEALQEYSKERSAAGMIKLIRDKEELALETRLEASKKKSSKKGVQPVSYGADTVRTSKLN